MLGLLLLVVFSTALVVGQSKYRTFSQQSLSEKKVHAGKSLGSKVYFTFTNDTIFTRHGIHFIVSAPVIAVLDSGGFPNITIDPSNRSIQVSGADVPPHSSVTLGLWVKKRQEGTEVNYWWWTNLNGQHILPTHTKLAAVSDVQLFTQPNGGNVRDYIYKKIVTRPNGVVIGIPRPDSAKFYGWIRYKVDDRKFFPDTSRARCFDFILKNSGLLKKFVGELKNPHVSKHDNHLLGEVHALRLAVIANDAGVTEPVDPSSTHLGDLIYNNSGNPSDPYNNMTIRQILHRADSLLTFCNLYSPEEYLTLDSTISKINEAFDGAYEAITFDPFLLAGTHSLGEVPWLLPNPAASPVGITKVYASIIDDLPDGFELRQNYPNPFNPTTTIEFNLGDDPVVVTLKVYNMLGQEVATILDEEQMDGGEQLVNFDASKLSSGVYLYTIVARGVGDDPHYYKDSLKMLFMK